MGGGGEGSLSGNNEAIGPHPKLQLPVTLALGINSQQTLGVFKLQTLKSKFIYQKGRPKEWEYLRNMV